MSLRAFAQIAAPKHTPKRESDERARRTRDLCVVRCPRPLNCIPEQASVRHCVSPKDHFSVPPSPVILFLLPHHPVPTPFPYRLPTKETGGVLCTCPRRHSCTLPAAPHRATGIQFHCSLRLGVYGSAELAVYAGPLFEMGKTNQGCVGEYTFLTR